MTTATRDSVIVRRRDDGDLERDIAFHAAPVVQEFIHDPTFVTGFFGPLGCGKTAAGAWKAWLYGQAWPGARILVTRATWPALRDTTQREYFEWFKPGSLSEYHVTDKTLFVPHAAGKPVEIVFRSLDDQRDIDNVLSLPIAAAHIDEPQGGTMLSSAGKLDVEPGIDHNLFLAILGRLGRQKGYRGMCWLTGNPPPPTHWVTKEFDYAPGASACELKAALTPARSVRRTVQAQATEVQSFDDGYPFSAWQSPPQSACITNAAWEQHRHLQ